MTREAYRRSSSFRIRALAVVGGPITLRQKPAISARISLFPAVSRSAESEDSSVAPTIPLEENWSLGLSSFYRASAFNGERRISPSSASLK